jgi:hypothetical protein
MERKKTWTTLLKAQRVKEHQTSQAELDDLRAVIERDLQDARIPELSADRRFATAYNAALQLAKAVIACEGYRVVGIGHHQVTFDALEIAMGASISPLAAYFDTCRRKRNQVDYDFANAASETEADELIEKTDEFKTLVQEWLREKHPTLHL